MMAESTAQKDFLKRTVFLRKAPWSKWRNLDRPSLQNLTVQMDDGLMDHLLDVILDCPFGRWSNGPPVRRHFRLSIWTMVQWPTCET